MASQALALIETAVATADIATQNESSAGNNWSYSWSRSRVMDNHHCCPKSYGCTSNAPTSHMESPERRGLAGLAVRAAYPSEAESAPRTAHSAHQREPLAAQRWPLALGTEPNP